MLYVVAMLQPVFPFLEYHSNKDYIANVLCENRDKPAMACNGKCYLKKQIVASNDIDVNDDSHNHSAPKIDMTKYPVSPVKNKKDKTYNLKKSKEQHIFYEIKTHTKKYVEDTFRPPLATV